MIFILIFQIAWLFLLPTAILSTTKNECVCFHYITPMVKPFGATAQFENLHLQCRLPFAGHSHSHSLTIWFLDVERT